MILLIIWLFSCLCFCSKSSLLFLYFAALAQNRKWNYCHVTKHHFSLTFVEVGCMGNIIINQKIKTIKTIKDFDSFDSLINWDSVHISGLNQGQCSTDKDLWKLIIIRVLRDHWFCSRPRPRLVLISNFCQDQYQD